MHFKCKLKKIFFKENFGKMCRYRKYTDVHKNVLSVKFWSYKECSLTAPKNKHKLDSTKALSLKMKPDT